MNVACTPTYVRMDNVQILWALIDVCVTMDTDLIALQADV